MSKPDKDFESTEPSELTVTSPTLESTIPNVVQANFFTNPTILPPNIERKIILEAAVGTNSALPLLRKTNKFSQQEMSQLILEVKRVEQLNSLLEGNYPNLAVLKIAPEILCEKIENTIDSFNVLEENFNKFLEVVRARSKTLTRLDIGDCHLGNHRISSLAEVLKDCPNLAVLNLEQNNFTHQGLVALVELVLVNCRNLESLNLSNNSITRQEAINPNPIVWDHEGLESMGDALSRCPSFKKLNLGFAGIRSNAQVEALFGILRKCPNLEDLNLKGNSEFSSLLLSSSLDSIKNLKRLNLQNVNININDLVKILENNKNIEELNLENQLERDDEVVSALGGCRRLKKLTLNCDLTKIAILENCPNLTDLELRDFYGNREGLSILANSIKKLQKLTVLRLSYRESDESFLPTARQIKQSLNFVKDDLANLAKAVEEHKNLTEFSLRHYTESITGEATKALADAIEKSPKMEVFKVCVIHDQKEGYKRILSEGAFKRILRGKDINLGFELILSTERKRELAEQVKREKISASEISSGVEEGCRPSSSLPVPKASSLSGLSQRKGFTVTD